MGLFDLFRKPRPIGDEAGLQTFLEEQTAFIVQKTTWEYSRIRAGIQWQKLFKEEAFKSAIETSTWGNYPLSLAFVGEMTVSTLRTVGGLEAPAVVPALSAVCRRVLSGQPDPRGVEADFWPKAQTFVSERINRTLVAPPKAVKDIPLDGYETFVSRMPIHAELTRHDAPLLLSTLRVQLCRSHEVLLERLDAPTLGESLARLSASDSP